MFPSLAMLTTEPPLAGPALPEVAVRSKGVPKAFPVRETPPFPATSVTLIQRSVSAHNLNRRMSQYALEPGALVMEPFPLTALMMLPPSAFFPSPVVSKPLKLLKGAPATREAEIARSTGVRIEKRILN